MWAVVINPSAGSGKGSIIGRVVIEFLRTQKIEYVIMQGETSREVFTNLSYFLDESSHCEGVITVGGDGSAHAAMQVTTPRGVPLAIVPGGTGNDFVRALGWRLDDVEGYLERIFCTPAVPIDLGQVGSEWFGAVLSTGFDSIVNERANSLSWPRGPMKYNIAIAMELPRFRPRNYEITLDERVISTRAMLIAVANGSSYGGGMLVCPKAVMTDGFFDVMILHPVSKLEFLKVFPQVFKGTHISHPAVEIVRSKTVTIKADAVAYADGERVGPLPVTAKCVSQAMKTWMP